VLLVGLAPQSEHRVGAALHGPVDHAGEMDAQKRELRPWHGIDEVPDQGAGLRQYLVVLTPKRHDAQLRSGSAQRCEAIRLQPAAVDDEASAEVAGRRRDTDALSPPLPDRLEAADLRPEHDAVPRVLVDALPETPAHRAIVHDARLRDMNGSHAARVGFERSQLRRIDELAGDAVLDA